MNIGCELLSLVRSGSQCYVNSNSQSPARFIINSLSATISNPALCGATPVTTNSYINMPTRPCTGYYSHGLYVAFLTRFDHTFLTTCKYQNQIKAAYLFQLTLVCTSNLPLSLASMWCVAGPLNLHHLLAMGWIISLFTGIIIFQLIFMFQSHLTISQTNWPCYYNFHWL